MRFRTLAILLILSVLFYGVTSQTYFQNLINTVANITSNNELMETARKKKKEKYFAYLLWGSLLAKSIIFPLAFKAMAVMTSIAVLFSALGLIMSSIVGYAKFAKSSNPAVKVVHKVPHNYNHWAKDDSALKNYYNNGETYEFVTPGLP